jgi:hypothetical protein
MGNSHKTQFWKGITQGSFQQSLVEIGSVVSEENILFLIASHHFTIFSLAAILVGSLDHRTQFWKAAIPWVCPFQKRLRQPCPPFRMATVAKNRYFFKWPKLLYFKPECAQI